MKAYSQFLRELPSKKVVFAFGDFQAPTISHELLIKTVGNLATEQNSAQVIYTSINEDKKNPLSSDRKTYFLKRMFPESTFRTCDSLLEAAKQLNQKYNSIVLVTGSELVQEQQKLLDKNNGKLFNFNSIVVISSGNLNSDSDTNMSKVRESVKKGDLEQFKECLSTKVTTMDAKRLMNEMREGMGLEVIKEELKLATDWLRESYYRGEIFKIGELVESNGQRFEIIDRGSNYVVVVDSDGNTSRKWIRDVVSIREDVDVTLDNDMAEVTYKGYKTKNFNSDHQVASCFQRLFKTDKDPVAILNALKATDEYLGIHQRAIADDVVTAEEEKAFGKAFRRAQDYLIKLGDLQHHLNYMNNTIHEMQQVKAKYHTGTFGDAFEETILKQGLMEMKFTATDKIKVARIIANALGIIDVEKTSSAEQLVNNALRKVRNKPMRPEYADVLTNMLVTARQAGIEYDEKLVPKKNKEVNEVSSNLLDRYKERAKKSAQDLSDKGEYRKSTNRYANIMKATGKQIEKTTANIKKALNKEETEQIDEISQKLAGNYYGAATKKHIDKVGVKPNMYDRIEKDMGKQRKVGVDRAMDRLTGNRKTNEETISEEEGYTLHSKHTNADGTTTVVLKSPSGKMIKHTGKDVHKVVKQRYGVQSESAVHKPELGLSDGRDVLKFSDYTRLLGAHQPFENSGDRTNDDLEAKYGKKTPDVEKAMSYQTPETSQYPFQPKGAVSTTAPEGTPAQVEKIPMGKKLYSQQTKYRTEEVDLGFEDLTEEDFDDEIAQIQDISHIIDAYDDSELVIIDEETGEELETVEPDSEDMLQEVLSRMERIRRKQRFARTKTKREIRTKIALKKTSSMPVLNKRAKRLAISMIKKRMLRKDPSKANFQEKERIEKFLSSRPQLVQRLSRRLLPKVRQIEKSRLQGKKVTK